MGITLDEERGFSRRYLSRLASKGGSVAKTVADCFKFRNKIGTDVAVEALRESLRDQRTSPYELPRSAAICRVEKVMQPYLKAVV